MANTVLNYYGKKGRETNRQKEFMDFSFQATYNTILITLMLNMWRHPTENTVVISVLACLHLLSIYLFGFLKYKWYNKKKERVVVWLFVITNIIIVSVIAILLKTLPITLAFIFPPYLVSTFLCKTADLLMDITSKNMTTKISTIKLVVAGVITFAPLLLLGYIVISMLIPILVKIAIIVAIIILTFTTILWSEYGCSIFYILARHGYIKE